MEKKNNAFWASILKLFFIPNILTKGKSMFYNFTELCISSLPWKDLETAEPVSILGWSSLTWGCTMSHIRTVPGMLHAAMGMIGGQPVAQAPATLFHHLQCHSYCVALKNEKEM